MQTIEGSYLNGRINLSQADSINDLIKAESFIQTKSALWEDLQADLTSGGLVNSSKLIKVIKLKMPSDNKKVLLNGFPKSKDNIDTWNKEMAESADIKGFVYLQVSDEKMNEVAVGDYAASVQTKINTFKTETLPVVDSLKAGDNFFTFDGSKNADELFNDIKQKFLDKKLYQ